MEARPQCVPILDRATLTILGSFYDGSGQPSVATAPPVGQPEFRLVTGDVADGRFLSYGVNLGRFATTVWYRLPPTVTKTVDRLGATLKPTAVSVCSSARSNSGPTLATLPGCAR